jgi:hypothetical protein
MEQMQDVRQVSETKRLLLLLPLPPAPLHRGARLSPLGAPAGLPVTARAQACVCAACVLRECPLHGAAALQTFAMAMMRRFYYLKGIATISKNA